MTIARPIPKTILISFIALAAFGCGSGASTDKSSSADSVKTDSVQPQTQPPAAAMPALTAPFDVMEVTINVKDFAAWRPSFDSNADNRKAAGLELLDLSQVDGKPNSVHLVFKSDDLKKAKGFYASDKTKEAMMKAGVTGKPELSMMHVIRFIPDSGAKHYVEVTHKVKNFAAWLKVYDAEGTAKRMSEGMMDVAVARDANDSNNVMIVFNITDAGKAKAAIASPDKKKTMQTAGVIGAPKILAYNSVQ